MSSQVLPEEIRLNPRKRLGREEIDDCTKEQLITRLLEIDVYAHQLEEHIRLLPSAEQIKQQQLEATRRENILVMRLATKEQEMQEYISQLQEMKQASNPNASQLRAMLLDPAINSVFQRMKKELEDSKKEIEEARNDLAAVKFTPESSTGKCLMARVRLLLRENEELGKQVESGKITKLETDLALEKKLVDELKKAEKDMESIVSEMEEELEAMQSSLYHLQQTLRTTREELKRVRDENADLRRRLHLEPDSVSATNEDFNSMEWDDGEQRTRDSDDVYSGAEYQAHYSPYRTGDDSASVQDGDGGPVEESEESNSRVNGLCEDNESQSLPSETRAKSCDERTLDSNDASSPLHNGVQTDSVVT